MPVAAFLRSYADPRPRVALALFSLLLCAPGLSSIPPLDRDEPLFAQSARQMLETGDFIDIRFQATPHYEKPILTYWAQAGAAALVGGKGLDRIWVYRLPSVLALVAASLLTFELGRTLFGTRVALSAGALLAATLLTQTQSHQGRSDALLLATVVAAALPLSQAYMYRFASRAGANPHLSRRSIALFWIALAAGILTKGPIAPMLVFLTVVAVSVVERDWRWLAALKPTWGIPLCVLVLAPWPMAMLHAHGGAFFLQAWRTDILPKLLTAQESHGAPPLAYALLAALSFWPATVLLPTAAVFAWRETLTPAVRFCLASTLPAWLVFELAPTKLPHYVLPLLPMILLLAVASVDPATERTAPRAAVRAGVALFVLGGIIIAATALVALDRLGTGIDAPSAFTASALLGATAVVAIRASRGSLRGIMTGLVLCGALATILVWGFVIPGLERLWIAQRATQAVRAIAAAAERPVVIAGYPEPSLVFLLGTATQFVTAESAATLLDQGASRAAITAADVAPAFVAAARERGTCIREVTVIDGIDPVHGRPAALVVWATCR